MSNLTRLSNLTFPVLAQVGTIYLTSLPSLKNLSFGELGVKRASSIFVTNTSLTSLSGFDIGGGLGSFYVSQNSFLSEIVLHGELAINSNNFSIGVSRNNMEGLGGTNVSLPEMVAAQIIELDNVS